MKKLPIPVLLASIIILTSVVVYSADAAGIPKKAISLVGQFVESDLPSTTVFTDAAKTITATITMNSLKLGGAEDANNQQINNLAAPTSATDAVRADNLGLLGNLVGGKCSNNNHLKYQSSNTTWICDPSSYLTSAVTSINFDSSAAQTITATGNVTMTNAGATHTISLVNSPGWVLTGGSDQKFSKNLDFGSGQTDKFGNTAVIVRNSANTFATTLAGGAVTANRTLNLPAITGSDTLASLGLSQSWGSGAKQTFQSSSTTAGLNLKGISSDPSPLSAGDIWRNTGSDTYKVRGATTTQIIKTTGGLVQFNNQTGSSPITISASNTPLMLGTGVTFTPTQTGRVLITFSCNVGSSALNNAAVGLQLAYGTGSAPSSGGTQSGTKIGETIPIWIVTKATFPAGSVPVTGSAVITGLTPGTTYWFDPQISWVTSGKSGNTDVGNWEVSIIEV